jgi:hypothetical protein
MVHLPTIIQTSRESRSSCSVVIRFGSISGAGSTDSPDKISGRMALLSACRVPGIGKFLPDDGSGDQNCSRAGWQFTFRWMKVHVARGVIFQ